MVCLHLILDIGTEPGEVVVSRAVGDEGLDLERLGVLELDHGLVDGRVCGVGDSTLEFANRRILRGLPALSEGGDGSEQQEAATRCQASDLFRESHYYLDSVWSWNVTSIRCSPSMETDFSDGW